MITDGKSTRGMGALVDGELPPKVWINGGTLEKILSKRENPAREMFLWHNGLWGQRQRRRIAVRGGVTAGNSPLLHTLELLDEIARYAYLPKDVLKVYRDQASAAQAAKKR